MLVIPIYINKQSAWQPVAGFEFYNINLMTRLHFLLFCLLISAALAQSNTCYANCLKGYCSSSNALMCTACDPGLLNINGKCVPSNVQPSPLTFLKPNPANTLLDYSNYNLINCSILQNQVGTSMLFQTEIGKSYTQQFNIPVRASYLRVKFNAILLTPTPASQTLSLLVNVVPSTNRRSFILSKKLTVSPNALSVRCNSSLPTINNYYGVFLMDEKLSSGNQSVIVEIIPQGLVSAYLAVSNYEIYYGNCDQTCATCVGPTPTECSSCRGLLMSLDKTGACVSCPPSFYLNVTCWPCPLNCMACQLTAQQLVCTACKSQPPLQFTLSNGACQVTQYSVASLTGNQTAFDRSNWTSSEVSGNPSSLCNYYQLLGGLSIGVANSYLTYTATNLPTHSNIYLFFSLLLIDQTPQDTYQYELIVDNTLQLVQFTIPLLGTTNECGGSQVEYLLPQNFTVPHNTSEATVTINIYLSFLGVRDFLLVVDNPTTDPNCLVFANNACQSCRNGLVVANGTCSGCLQGYYSQWQEGQPHCLPCQLTCASCSNDSQCTSCLPPLTLDGPFCVDTNSNLQNAELVPGVPFANQPINWTYYPNLQNKGIDSCGNTQIIGSSQIRFKFLSMSRLFTNLPPHTGALLYFTLFQIDDNYFPQNALYFTFNGNTYTQDNITGVKQLSTLQMQLCGNASADSVFTLQLKDSTHTANTLDFALHLNRMGKVGISNLQLYLLNTPANNVAAYSLEIAPAYSIDTPPDKGLQVKLRFSNPFVNTSDIHSAFLFTLLSPARRLQEGDPRYLQEGYANELVTVNNTYSNTEIVYLLNLTQDYTSNAQIQVRPASQNSVYFASPGGGYSLVSQAAVSTPITRYVNIDLNSASDRSSMRNLFNLFRGCAILALFFGMASFLVGMSAAFDDFFVLCQVVFVHVFIQLSYNPPSLLVPFSGLHIVQFLAWLPAPARTAIEDAILPDSLYQYTPLPYQQFFRDTVFARTIYHTLLYFALLLALWLLLHAVLLIYEANHPHEKTQYQNFFVYYYKIYDSRALVLVDKIVRFAYFTVVWACILQFVSFSNSPQSFHIWNSILTVVLFIAALVYPVVMFLVLRSNANSLADKTFGLAYEDLRIEKEKLYYYLVRYYKLLIIAIAVGTTYNTTPVVPLIILIILHAVDAILLLALKPLGMMQPEVIQATVFYPLYPNLYYYTTIAQQFLFIVMEIFFLILVGLRSSASSSAYMGVGYAICVVVILLLLNGLFRLLWGLLKQIQYCYLQRQANYMSVAKQMHENDPLEHHPILTGQLSQAQLSKKDITSKLFSNKKLSYVSKIR